MTVQEMISADKQEIFNRGKKHLLTQNFKCTLDGTGSKEDTPVWRNEIGQRCAIGALLDDEAIDELTSKGMLSCDRFKNAYDMNLDTLYFLERLQGIHDARDPHEWPRFLEALANEEGLRYDG